ncbi:MAG: hypothetical protein U0350_24165 [Caldilineaceae bacterium]
MSTEISEKQNVTLVIPKALLRKAKILAAERQTSLSKLMIEALTEIVEKSDRYEQARRRHLAWLEQGADLGFEGKIPWSREELHER